MYHVLQDTVVAIKLGGDSLTIANMDEKKYPTTNFSLDPKQVLIGLTKLHFVLSGNQSVRTADCVSVLAESGS